MTNFETNSPNHELKKNRPARGQSARSKTLNAFVVVTFFLTLGYIAYFLLVGAQNLQPG